MAFWDLALFCLWWLQLLLGPTPHLHHHSCWRSGHQTLPHCHVAWPKTLLLSKEKDVLSRSVCGGVPCASGGMVLCGLGVSSPLARALCWFLGWELSSWEMYGWLFTIHGAVLLWWHSIHYPKVHCRTVKVIRNGRKLFFFQWLESQIVKSEMCLGGCSCAYSAGYRLDWDTLACPWQFCFFNLDSLNTNVPPQMSENQLNLLSPI